MMMEKLRPLEYLGFGVFYDYERGRERESSFIDIFVGAGDAPLSGISFSSSMEWHYLVSGEMPCIFPAKCIAAYLKGHLYNAVFNNRVHDFLRASRLKCLGDLLDLSRAIRIKNHLPMECFLRIAERLPGFFIGIPADSNGIIRSPWSSFRKYPISRADGEEL